MSVSTFDVIVSAPRSRAAASASDADLAAGTAARGPLDEDIGQVLHFRAHTDAEREVPDLAPLRIEDIVRGIVGLVPLMPNDPVGEHSRVLDNP